MISGDLFCLPLFPSAVCQETLSVCASCQASDEENSLWARFPSASVRLGSQ